MIRYTESDATLPGAFKHKGQVIYFHKETLNLRASNAGAGMCIAAKLKMTITRKNVKFIDFILGY